MKRVEGDQTFEFEDGLWTWTILSEFRILTSQEVLSTLFTQE